MKNIFTLFLLISSLALPAQNNSNTDLEIDERLYEVFDVDYLTRLKTQNPVLIQRWNFYLDHAWYITDAPKEKVLVATKSVQITDLNKVNILQLEQEQTIRKNSKKRMAYTIAGTDKVLIYYSGQQFIKKLNEHLGR